MFDMIIIITVALRCVRHLQFNQLSFSFLHLIRVRYVSRIRIDIFEIFKYMNKKPAMFARLLREKPTSIFKTSSTFYEVIERT